MNAQTMAEMDQVYEVDGQAMSKDGYEAALRERLKKLHSQFASQRDEWVKHRCNTGVEERWKVARTMYLGGETSKSNDALSNVLKNGPNSRRMAAQEASRSRVVINIVRPKIDQAVARICEILLPVDDKNWGIKPTPVPDMVSAMVGNTAETIDDQDQLTGRTADQEAQMVMKQAKTKAVAMEREIDDVMTECGYNGEQRKLIEEGVMLGTGLMLGPFPKNAPKRSWVAQPDGCMTLKIDPEVKPASMWVSVWSVWFDPACGNDHQRGQGFYHQRFATRKELRALIGIPGYDENSIREVLRTKPTRTRVSGGRVERTACEEDAYEMWVYYGQVEPDDMSMLSEAAGDPLDNVSDGMIVMIGDSIIGAMESCIPDGSLPIDRWVWRSSDDSPYGYGLADEMINQQSVVNAAWRQVMDDAKHSIGGQFVIKKKLIEPQDGSYEAYPNKIWLASAELEDVTKAMHSFEFKNHSAELLSIAAAAMQFADQETSMPQMMGGDKGNAPETVGGMVMLYNSSNVVLRMRVKLYDDNLTRPHIRRHFDYQMATNPNQEIKGDMDIDARGSTALLEKDIQNQATLNLANVTNNPRYAAFLDPKEELKLILKAFKANPEDIMLTDEKIEQNLQNAQSAPPPDPRIQSAQLMLQGKEMDIADRKEQRQVDVALAQGESQIKSAQIQYTTERERAESVQKQTESQIDRELAIAGMQQDGILTREELQSKERLQAIDLDVKTQLFSAEAAIKARQGSGI